MGKPVELTWYDDEDAHCVEVVLLLSDDDIFRNKETGKPQEVMISDGNWVDNVSDFSEGIYVVFENETGVFRVDAKKIVNISVLEDS